MQLSLSTNLARSDWPYQLRTPASLQQSHVYTSELCSLTVDIAALRVHCSFLVLQGADQGLLFNSEFENSVILFSALLERDYWSVPWIHAQTQACRLLICVAGYSYSANDGAQPQL